MNKNIKITASIDGENYTVKQLQRIEFERQKHVLQEMIHYGATVKKNDEVLSYDDINYLTYEEARNILLQTKLNLGLEGVKELYANSMKKSDEFWRNVDAQYTETEDYQEATGYMSVTGLTLEQLKQTIYKSVDGDISGLTSNPEHFFDEKLPGLKQNEKCGTETMGMFGSPVETIVIFDPTITGPAKEEDGYKIFISGTSTLLDGTPRHDVAVHQVREHENGFDLKMTVYYPKSVPQEMVDGHKLHLLIEFMGGIIAAADSDL